MEAGAIAAGAAVAVVTAGLLRRIPAAMSTALLALGSAAVAWGVIGLRPDPSTQEVLLAVVLMAVLGPAHVRAVLGPLGPR